MAKAAKPIPDRCRTVTPHLVVDDAPRALEFYKAAFGAVEHSRSLGPDGRSVMHAEIQIGDSVLFLCDQFPEMGVKSPKALDGTPVTIHLFVEDADTWFQRAADAGATAAMPLHDAFWGDRYGQLVDPFGHRWSIATHVEDLTPEEMRERAVAAFGG